MSPALSTVCSTRMTCTFSEPGVGKPKSTPESLWEDPGEMGERTFLGENRPRPRLAFRLEPAAMELAGLAGLGPPPRAISDLRSEGAVVMVGRRRGARYTVGDSR